MGLHPFTVSNGAHSLDVSSADGSGATGSLEMTVTIVQVRFAARVVSGLKAQVI